MDNGHAPASGSGALDEAGALRVLDAATATFGSEEKARAWLHRPTRALHGASPDRLLRESPNGEAQVIDLLHRIDHGLAS